jgi:hypothetical protein
VIARDANAKVDLRESKGKGREQLGLDEGFRDGEGREVRGFVKGPTFAKRKAPR